jgi:Fe-S oxidoreductase
VYSLVKDIFEMLVVVGAGYALWRRLRPKPSRVGRSWEGVFILCMIIALMLTDFLVSGAEAVARGRSPLPWSPGGWLGALAVPRDAAHWVGVASYWAHCSLVLLFLNFLPLGKHFHVITGIPRVFFRDLRPYGRAPKDDLEGSERFGIATTADLSWSMVLDLYSCTECGRCSMYCPTVLTGKPLEHRQLNLDLKAALFADGPARLAGKSEGLAALVGADGPISPDTIWACTTCGSCEQECPVFIENVPRILEMRKHKVLMEGDVSPELARAYKGMEQNSNPWGIGFDQRDAWASAYQIPRMSDLDAAARENPPILYWIGCAGSFDDRSKKITVAMVQILQAAKLPFAILGKEEGCSGDPARRTGNEYLFQMLAQQNIEVLNRYGVKKVLTHCPHCLHTLKTEYPQFGGNYEVVHHTQLIEQLLSTGQLKLTREVRETIAWHDSCYLGRYHNIYDAPRNVVKAVPGASLVELPRNKSRSVCCGAGGGRFWMEETIGERINVHRAKEVVATEASTCGSSCPFCLVMMRDGIADLGQQESVAAQDVAEIVARSI